MELSTSDRIQGLLFGLAAGDQIGGPVHMAIQLSKSLLDSNGFDEKSVIRYYYTWWNEAGFDTGYIAHNVFNRMKQGKINREAVDDIHRLTGGMTGGCNPMHRATPLALLRRVTDDQLSQYARKEARLTHYDFVAGEYSLFVIRLCRSLIDGQPFQEALAHIYRTSTDSLTIINELSDLINLNKQKPYLNKPLSNGGYSPDVLRAALYYLQTNNTFESALSASVVFAGAANFCPVVVGAVAGAQYGYQAIPAKFMKHPTLIPELETLARQFIKNWDK